MQYLLRFIFLNVISVLQLIFQKLTHTEMKVWRNHLFNYLLFTIMHKYSIVQNFKEPMKAAETAVDIVSKILTGTSAVKFSVTLLPANIAFVNCSGLKLPQDFQNTQKQALLKVILWKKCFHRCFAVKFAKFLRTPISKNICTLLLLNTEAVF